MTKRNDADISFTNNILCKGMDAFILEQKENNQKFNYMHIVIAGIVRMLAERPRVNRFVMSGRIYARKAIAISFVVKQKLEDDGNESVVKLSFTGKEDIYKIREMIDQAIIQATKPTESNVTDKLIKYLFKLPHFILSPAIGFLKLLDKMGALPKSLLEASPFHTSVFLTNMKSIRTGHLHHHIYNFGTTGIFTSMGKENKEAVVDLNDNTIVEKIMKLGLVIDERVCDGFYYAKSLKLATKYIENPNLLTTELENIVKDPDL